MPIHTSAPSAPARLPHLGGTPLVKVRLRMAGVWCSVRLKTEGRDPTGSSEDRAALALMTALERRGRPTPESIVNKAVG